MYICTYIHTYNGREMSSNLYYIHTYIHTYIHKYIHIYIHAYNGREMGSYIYMHTYIQTYIHTYNGREMGSYHSRDARTNALKRSTSGCTLAIPGDGLVSASCHSFSKVIL